MVSATDIPDYHYGQLGLLYNYHAPTPPTLADLELFYKASPIHQLSKNISSNRSPVACPTQILLGRDDLRVPYYQGLNWFYWLKAQRLSTELYIFPENGHGLVKKDAERAALELPFTFFNQYL